MERSFPCYWVTRDEAGQVRTSIHALSVDELPPGEVLIQVAYSSLNYKDALAASGHLGVAKQLPHVPGIDAAGTVVESESNLFRPGDAVIVTGYGLGEDRFGGWSAYVRMPAHHLVPLPAGLTLFESMAYGTAGFTAGQAVTALIERGIEPSRGPIVVTGASGGVGSLAVGLLSQLGYHVVAVSGKAEARPFLQQLGAAEVLDRQEVDDTSGRPLLSGRWAGAIDTVGGNPLATLLRSTLHRGVVAACGLVAGVEVPLTVYPFILRGVNLVGIDSAQCPMGPRREIWTRLAGPWKLARLESLTETIHFEQLDGYVKRILAGQMIGRVVVEPPPT